MWDGGCGYARLCYGRLCSPIVGSVLHREMKSQVVKRIVTAGFRWCWLGDGGAVLLGNVIAGFHGGAVLLASFIAGGWECHSVIGECHECHCKFPWLRGVIRECHCRFPWWCGVIGNVIADFHGGGVRNCHCRFPQRRGVIGGCHCRFYGCAVLLGNVIAGLNGGGVFGECQCRFPWQRGVIGGIQLQVVKRIVMVVSR